MSLQEPQSISDALAILGDTHNRSLPIYRSGEDGVATLATAVFNLKVWPVRRQHVVIALLKPGVQSTIVNQVQLLQASRVCVFHGNPKLTQSMADFPWTQDSHGGFEAYPLEYI